MMRKPVIIEHSEHQLDAEKISKNALSVLEGLQMAGFEAYLVGGAVRDILLGLSPKDFDIATSASPEEIHKLFRNCRLIGRRFRLAHLHFRGEIVEVATFRGNTNDCHADTGMILRDNIYGSLEEDAWRRDFTMNALYYNHQTLTITDHTGGMQDLQQKMLRMIGTASLRYQEDPVRMLRAMRLAGKLDLSIEPQTAKPIKEMADSLLNIPGARLFDELLKWFFSGASFAGFDLLCIHEIFPILFSQTAKTTYDPSIAAFLQHGFQNADQRIKDGKSLNPAFFLAFLLWPPLQIIMKRHQKNGMKYFPALQLAIDELLTEQRKILSIPQRFTLTAKSIWLLQSRLTSPRRKMIYKTFDHPRFRAAYDFLLLREQSGENVSAAADWWTKFQEVSNRAKQRMLKDLEKKPII